jgi:ParB-like nuclease domain/DNA methylase
LKTGSGDCRGGAGLTIGLPFQGDGARIARFPVLSENWGILAHYQARYRAEAGGSSPDAGVRAIGPSHAIVERTVEGISAGARLKLIFVMSVGKPALPILNLAVVYRATNSIKPEPRNARTHSKKQVAEIAASIRQFGFSNPLLTDVDGVIIAGHGRLLAAKSIGLDSLPTITLPHLDEAQRRALRLADNKIALNAVWDRDLLKLELKELADLEIDFDLSLTGFSTGEIDVLLTPKGDPDDETIPAVPVQPRTRLGDIWICGQHRVGCGDGRDLDYLRKVIGNDAAIDSAFLDPPYNVRISGHANAKGRHREFAMASGEMTDEAFRAFLFEALSACARVSRDGAVHFVCMDWRHMDDVGAVGKQVYGDLLNLCFWNKSNAGMGSLYRSKHELIFVYRVGATPHLNMVELGKHGRNRTNVWDYASVTPSSGVGAKI